MCTSSGNELPTIFFFYFHGAYLYLIISTRPLDGAYYYFYSDTYIIQYCLYTIHYTYHIESKEHELKYI